MFINIRFILIIIVCLILNHQVQAQELDQKFDKVLDEYVKLDQFSGSILVAKDGQVLYAKAFGEANKDHHVKNTLDTKFNIGSAGKTLTGISIMQLEEKGKINVTDPVIKYLDDFPFGDQITIHHLLTHTSGTYNYFAHPQFRSKMASIRSVSDALPLIYDQSLLFDTPGEQFAYSNSGIVILGAVIEKVAGQRYIDYLRHNILDPARMNDTDINYWDEIEEDRACGYIKSPTGKFKSNIYLVPPANADGGIETTVGDLLKYDQALYGTVLLSEESKKMMFTPFLNNYAYCWRIEHKYGNTITGHSGGAPGVSASFKRYMTDKYTIIVLSNYSNGATHVAKTIEAIVFGDEYELPKVTLSEFLYQNMKNKGITYTIQNIDEILIKDGYEIKSSNTLNALGYEILGENELDMAIEIFKLNVRLFPEEANPYDSLAEAYMKKGDNKLAIEYYTKALEVDSTFTNAIKMLGKLTEK